MMLKYLFSVRIGLFILDFVQKLLEVSYLVLGYACKRTKLQDVVYPTKSSPSVAFRPEIRATAYGGDVRKILRMTGTWISKVC